jgi:hypothetical protein
VIYYHHRLPNHPQPFLEMGTHEQRRFLRGK